MIVPKISSVSTTTPYNLLVTFDNQQKRKYDVSPLLKKDMFLPLKNRVLFNSVQVEQGGYAVVWNDCIDISEYELWMNGEVVIQ